MTWRGLWVCSAIFGLFAAAYQVAGIEPSRPADLLFSYGPSAAVAVWVDADARRRRRSPAGTWARSCSLRGPLPCRHTVSEAGGGRPGALLRDWSRPYSHRLSSAVSCGQSIEWSAP